MFKGPRWKKRWRNRFKNSFTSNNSSQKRVFGGLLCLFGFGIILAAVPGWMYLLLLGGGMIYWGLTVLQ